MAIRFTAQSISELGTTYTVGIDDTAYASSATDIEINGFQIAYDPDEQDDPASPIISSSCTFQIQVYPNIKTAVNTLISDMIEADEGRFRIYITDAASEIYWLGFVITDQISVEDQAWADLLSVFTIHAVDGISRLKDLDYNDSGTAYSGRELLIDHLFNIIDKIGLLDFYGGTDDVLISLCRWYESDMGATLNKHAFSLTYADHEAFISRDGEGNETFKSCYDVLKALAQLFLARFYYSGGAWRLDQIKEYDPATVTTHYWYKDRSKRGTTTDSLVVVEGSDDILRLGAVNAREFYFAAARRIELSYKHVNDRNYLAGYQWTTSTAAYTSTPVGRDGVRLWVRGIMSHTASFTPSSDFRNCIFIFEFQVVCLAGGTTYYLKQDYGFNTAGVLSYAFPEWTTDSSDRYHWVTTTINTYNGVAFLSPVDFETPNFPGSGEFAVFGFDIGLQAAYTINNGSAPSLAFPTTTWQMDRLDVRLNSDDETALTETSIFSKNNGDSPNASLVLKYETVLADSPSSGFFTSSSLTIDNSGTEEIAQAWAKGVGGGGKKIQNLWLDELMTLRNKALPRYEGQLLGAGYHFHAVWENIPNEKWIGHRVTFDSKSDIWAGDWWQVGINRAISGTLAGHINEPGPGVVGNPPGTGPVLPKTITGVGTSDPVATSKPTAGHPVTSISADVLEADGPFTSIPINPICAGVDGVIASGDTITIYDPLTGNSYDFTVTGDVAGGDTTISVSSATPGASLSAGSLVIIDTCSFVGNVRSVLPIARYQQKFTNVTGNSVTVTENAGVLPSGESQIDVYINGVYTDEWTATGSDIGFTFTVFSDDIVIVKFWA